MAPEWLAGFKGLFWPYRAIRRTFSERSNRRIGKAVLSATLFVVDSIRVARVRCTHMAPKTQLRARDRLRRQNNAAEHNDSCSGCIDSGPRGSCHCRAVRTFCLPRSIRSGTETGTQTALDALALSARTTTRRLAARMSKRIRSLAKFAELLRSGAELSQRYRFRHRQKLRSETLPSPDEIRSSPAWAARSALHLSCSR